MWYYKRAVTIDGNRIGQVYYKIYRWHKVNEETSLGYAFFMTDRRLLSKRFGDLHIDNCIVKQIICIREIIFRVRCIKHDTRND